MKGEHQLMGRVSYYCSLCRPANLNYVNVLGSFNIDLTATSLPKVQVENEFLLMQKPFTCA